MGEEIVEQRGNRVASRRDWEPTFLAALSKHGIVQFASDAVGVSRSTVYRHRKADAEFAKCWDEACEAAYDALELEAWRRAVDGVDEPLVSAGRLVLDKEGEPVMVRRYSDQLMRDMLRAHRSKFRAPTEVKHSGSIGLTVAALAQKAAEGRRALEGGEDGDD